MTTPLQDLVADAIETAALAYAAKWRLVDIDGQVWCAQGCERLALLPSLHCAQCLDAHYARNGIVRPLCVNREQRPLERKASNG